MKTFLNSIYGIMIVAGFLLIGCDTGSYCQLIVAVLFGFGLICLGGRCLIKNNRVV